MGEVRNLLDNVTQDIMVQIFAAHESASTTRKNNNTRDAEASDEDYDSEQEEVTPEDEAAKVKPCWLV
eukprot:CAMPEP_0176390828 /NCGR_PEP_ID=MMETSP0126-20121128/39514_1 /TAXON_ID=141414 ORGANISM="Strombidinopsis acuminatum, Strain SPMC142" /NCGR_SAMPLE_ID=MMETSP0126 /ASSEMBLY_ACC=CAM_ASM_000229 /LENGTH=67 /DNA_ID=CAMNT_0017760527 /DNA_START=960 /DNA_END=1163 /DNA_ORIENTATION=+